MKANKKIIITVVITLAVGILLGWLMFGGSAHQPMPDDHDHTSESEQGTVWTCSMHPQIRQHEPGKCPICGMDLIPLQQDEGGLDPMAVSMSPTAMQLAHVETAVVGEGSPVKTIRLNGKVESDERLVFSQSSHIPGRIEKLTVNFTGELVRKGQVIAYVYSPELVTAQEELFEANKIKESQPQLFKAAREKLRNWKLTDQQIDKVLASEKPQEVFPVLSDGTGYVINKMVNPGDYITKGTSIYRIADLSKVWILFDVYESDIPWIKKGDQVEFTIASLPGEVFNSTISFIDPVIDPKTRVAKARVEVRNSNLNLKPEMFVSGVVQARISKGKENLVIPKTAVMWTGKRSVVYIKNATAAGVSFRMREVTLGPALGERFIVESGLQPGEEIAVNGTFSIDAAAQLAGKPSMMNPAGGPAMTGHDHGGMAKGVSGNSVNHDSRSAQATISSSAKKILQPVFLGYLQMKDALTRDDLAAARRESEKMKTALSKIDMSVFTGESHKIWMQHSNTLENVLQHMPHQDNIRDFRDTFRQLSDVLIALAQSFNPMDEPIYVTFCPMADDNKGAYWLSDTQEIKNPYFGAGMLTCGEVTSTIQ